jgi:hypothetical protein
LHESIKCIWLLESPLESSKLHLVQSWPSAILGDRAHMSRLVCSISVLGSDIWLKSSGATATFVL